MHPPHPHLTCHLVYQKVRQWYDTLPYLTLPLSPRSEGRTWIFGGSAVHTAPCTPGVWPYNCVGSVNAFIMLVTTVSLVISVNFTTPN